MERFIIEPSVQYFGGLEVTKDTAVTETIKTETKKIIQTISNLVLTTKIIENTEYKGMKIRERSEVTVELKEGMKLLWSNEAGYIVPQYKIVRVEEAIDLLNQIKE